MTSVFIDTSYLLALEIANDQNHETALQHWRQAVKALPKLVTTYFDRRMERYHQIISALDVPGITIESYEPTKAHQHD